MLDWPAPKSGILSPCSSSVSQSIKLVRCGFDAAMRYEHFRLKEISLLFSGKDANFLQLKKCQNIVKAFKLYASMPLCHNA